MITRLGQANKTGRSTKRRRGREWPKLREITWWETKKKKKKKLVHNSPCGVRSLVTSMGGEIDGGGLLHTSKSLRREYFCSWAYVRRGDLGQGDEHYDDDSKGG